MRGGRDKAIGQHRSDEARVLEVRSRVRELQHVTQHVAYSLFLDLVNGFARLSFTPDSLDSLPLSLSLVVALSQ